MNKRFSIPPKIKEWLRLNTPKGFEFDLAPSQNVVKDQRALPDHYLLRSCHDVIEVRRGINRCWFHMCSQCGDLWVWWSYGTIKTRPIKENVGICLPVEGWEKAWIMRGMIRGHYVLQVEREKLEEADRIERDRYRAAQDALEKLREKERIRQKRNDADETRENRQSFYYPGKPCDKTVIVKPILRGGRMSKRRALALAALQAHREQDQQSERDNLKEFVLSEALPQLDGRERLVIEQRFGFRDRPHTLEECGKQIGFTRETVRKIQRKALRKLNALIEKQHYHENPQP